MNKMNQFKLVALILLLVTIVFVLSSCGEKPNGICDACNNKKTVKLYKITSPYNEVRYMNLCTDCAKEYKLSVSLLNGTIEEAQQRQADATTSAITTVQPTATLTVSSTATPTATMLPIDYGNVPITTPDPATVEMLTKTDGVLITPDPELAKTDPDAYYQKILELEELNGKPINPIWPDHKENGWDVLDLSLYPLENQTTHLYQRSELTNGDYLNDAGIIATMNYLGLTADQFDGFLRNHPHMSVYNDGILLYEIYHEYINSDTQTVSPSLTRNARSYLCYLVGMDRVVTVFSY